MTYQIFTLQRSTAVEDEIVRHCTRPSPNRAVISEFDGGISVIRIADTVVKCGLGVTHLEAWNQFYARMILPPTVIRVPLVYQFFRREYNGYLIMEYISGQRLTSVTDPEIYLEPIANVLRKFEQIRQDQPGPFHGGQAFGRLWLDYDPPVVTKIEEIEEYYNTRQLEEGPRLKLKEYPLVFCHLDMSPRNILVLDDRSLCLIDWKTAGFYPRLFERVTIDMNRRGAIDWHTKLLKLMHELDENEGSQGYLLMQAAYLAVRYN